MLYLAQVLIEGGSAVDCVEAAVVSMEADPLFDAGQGIMLYIYDFLGYQNIN